MRGKAEVGKIIIKDIIPAGTADVYNMEVEEVHDFVVNDGFVAHNCYDALRYMCMARPVKATDPRVGRRYRFSPYDDEDERRR